MLNMKRQLVIIHLYTLPGLIGFVTPIQLRAPQALNFFCIFLPFIEPFTGEEKLPMDFPVTAFLDLRGTRFSDRSHIHNSFF